MKQAETVVIDLADRRAHYRRNCKPALSRRFFTGLAVSFPISSVIWAGIIYAAARLTH